MRRLFPFIFLVYYSLGTLLFPMGDWSRMTGLKQMYEQCREEDWDINPLEFVVEHMLVLQPLAAHFEEKNAANSDDKPHQTAFSHSVVQLCSLCAPHITFQPARLIYGEKKIFFLPSGGFVLQQFRVDIFRPPIA